MADEVFKMSQLYVIKNGKPIKKFKSGIYAKAVKLKRDH